MSKPLDVTGESFEAEVLRSDLTVLVDFWAAWCGPCRLIAPVVEELADEYDGTLKIVKVDVAAHKQLAFRYRIMGIPTLGLFVNGALVSRIIGYKPKAELQRLIEATGLTHGRRPVPTTGG